MLAIYKRELQGYFYSPIAYIFIGIFALLAGIVFTMNNTWAGSANFNGMLGNMTFLFMIVVPILTMRLLSEERKNKTDQLLLTSPASISSIVMGKYFAALTVFVITLVITFMYPVILFIYGNPSISEIFSGYLGYLFLGAALIAVGVFISALGENQIVSAFVTLGVLFAIWLGSNLLDLLTSLVGSIQIGFLQWIADRLIDVLEWLSVYNRFTPFSKGLFSVTDVFYYLSFAAVFVFLTIRTIESRRWR